MNPNDLTGLVFGELTVRGVYAFEPYKQWKCMCSCGRTVIESTAKLQNKVTTSCGCTKKVEEKTNLPRIKKPSEIPTKQPVAMADTPAKAPKRPHWRNRPKERADELPSKEVQDLTVSILASTASVEHMLWRSIIDRCTAAGSPLYEYYGKRGISVCRSWREKFSNFMRDMGPMPSPDVFLIRHDPFKDYTPDNCFWGIMAGLDYHMPMKETKKNTPLGPRLEIILPPLAPAKKGRRLDTPAVIKNINQPDDDEPKIVPRKAKIAKEPVVQEPDAASLITSGKVIRKRAKSLNRKPRGEPKVYTHIYEGVSYTTKELSRHLNKPYQEVYNRLVYLNWSVIEVANGVKNREMREAYKAKEVLSGSNSQTNGGVQL